MSAQGDEALVRRLFEEVWNQHDPETAKEIVADHYASIENRDFDATPGPKIVADEVELYDSLYDDLKFQVDRTFTSGGTIVTTWFGDRSLKGRVLHQSKG